jgi:hypothetical protein
MITAVGLGTDPTIRHFCEVGTRLGAKIRLVDLADVVDGDYQLSLPPDGTSWVSHPLHGRWHLDPDDAYYCRLIDLGSVCPAQSIAWRTVITGLGAWLELAPGVVVNRPGHINDNACKPLHESLLASTGFPVPDSFTGSRRADLIEFTSAGSTIAKALSGQRVDCRHVTVDDFTDYDDRSGPVHLQRFVPGDDVRSHVVGDRVISARIRSERIDYRTDRRAAFEPYSLPDRIAELLCKASAHFQLAFVGWDLRIDGDDWWILEANPMPGYSYYDTKLEERITRLLLEYLQRRVRKESADDRASDHIGTPVS